MAAGGMAGGMAAGGYPGGAAGAAPAGAEGDKKEKGEKGEKGDKGDKGDKDKKKEGMGKGAVVAAGMGGLAVGALGGGLAGALLSGGGKKSSTHEVIYTDAGNSYPSYGGGNQLAIDDYDELQARRRAEQEEYEQAWDGSDSD
ncbi:hypothetical protein LOY91_005802 [Ophidiomyces ophidiicola]|nr:hypothetical protein LOY91_005802 [Ophidiomyces ophidiicola]